MSFYTALTGLKGAQTDIATTSNNIANVGSSGFKRAALNLETFLVRHLCKQTQLALVRQQNRLNNSFLRVISANLRIH